MSKRQKPRDQTASLADTDRKNLPTEARQIIAHARNDITIPYFSGAMQNVDDTLLQQGGGKGLKIYDEIERDTHAWAMLQKRKKVLVARKWEVAPASDAPRDLAAAELAERCLKALPFDRITEDFLDATLKGFAICEVVWKRVGGYIMPDAIIAHDQRRFVFDFEGAPRLLTFANMSEGEALPERKFIVHRHGVKGNNPYGLGLGTRLFWPVLFKREGIAFWLHFLDKFAGPTIIGQTPYGTVTEEQQRFLNTLTSIRTAAAVAVPIGSDVKFLEAARGGNVAYQEFLAYWDKQISICVTGETLTTDIGNAGSKAASETHSEIMEMLVDSDGDLLSDSLRQQLLTWIVDYNMPGAGVPTLYRTRPDNEMEIAAVDKAVAEATVARVKAVKDVLSVAAKMPDDASAKNYIVVSKVFDGLDEASIDNFVRYRHGHAGGAPSEVETDDQDNVVPLRVAGFADPLKKKDPRHEHVCFAEAGGPVDRITTQLLQAARAHQKRRIEAIRKAITAESYEAASRNLVELAAIWSPDVEARLLMDAMELAAYEGREAVYLEIDGTVSLADYQSISMREQIDFLRQKRPMPTRSWLDARRGDHDRAFVVAGVKDIAMLEEFQAALVRAAEGGVGIKGFAADFDNLVEKYGWDYKGERDWRIRTIYETNMRTSFMAGRLKQMRDPDVVRLRPYWQYRHADARIPAMPRKVHKSWDGLVLAWDDPWWDTHFPPNDWMCSCGVRTLSRGDMRRLGKSGPDTAPLDATMPVISQETGQMVMQPVGIGEGWDYMPGDQWERGLVPSRLLDDPDAVEGVGTSLVSIDTGEPITDLIARARKIQAPTLATGLPVEDYVSAFLKPFGAEIGKPVLWEDVTGAKLLISEQMFLDRTGQWKAEKRGRDVHLAQLAEAITDPDEVWIGVKSRQVKEYEGFLAQTVYRRYLRIDPETGLMAVFEMGRKFWQAKTSFAPRNRSKPDFAYLDRQRIGKLLWKRK